MNIKQTLEELGYKLKDDNTHWRSAANHRGGDNPTSLRINKETGSFIDFVTSESGSFTDLLKKNLGDGAEEKIKNLDFVNTEIPKKFKSDKLIIHKTFRSEDLGTTIKNYNFYNKKGISTETQKIFDASVCMSGKMCRRVVFPICRPSGELSGFAGRSIFPDNEMKWKLLGSKKDWCYPLHLSEEFIKSSKEVILVESIGDCLALWDAGIKNILCLFGTKLLKGIKQELLRLSPKKVYICTNNEPDNHSRGNNAAISIYKDLAMFFSEERLEIKLPPQKDFGECSKQEIFNWNK